MQKFWIVIAADQHPMQATQRHATRELASDEAERLVKKTSGKTFIVLEAIEVVKPATMPVVREPLETDTE
jgi:hypothetical protein